MAVIEVNDATFEKEVLRSAEPVLIDLYADWCQPCKQIAPIVAELAAEHAGKLKVVKIDVDKSPMVAQSFRVQSIPMLVVIHQGRIVDRVQGAVDKASIQRMLEPVLPRDAAEIPPKELAQLLTARRVVPVDIRDPGSYARYRIPTAINLPEAEVMTKMESLAPVDGRVRVLYGRSGADAKELAEKLQAAGVEVAFLAGGFLHWEADGLEVERGAPTKSS